MLQLSTLNDESRHLISKGKLLLWMVWYQQSQFVVSVRTSEMLIKYGLEKFYRNQALDL